MRRGRRSGKAVPEPEHRARVLVGTVEGAHRRVVVVGDLILDRYVTGLVERISPEAPIQVLAVERDKKRLGGAGRPTPTSSLD